MDMRGDTLLDRSYPFTTKPGHSDLPIRQVIMGSDGTLWLRTQRQAGHDPWLVLDPSGDSIGTLLVAPGSSLNQPSAGVVWMVERDQDDLPSVVRYRVRP